MNYGHRFIKILTSLDEMEAIFLSVTIFSPDGHYRFESRTIRPENKGIATARDDEETPLDATAVWAGVGK